MHRNHGLLGFAVMLTATAALTPAPARAQCPLTWTSTDPPNTSDSAYARSVAVSGDLAVVGLYTADPGAPSAGSAYLFDAKSGSLLRTFNNPSPRMAGEFGWSVCISGNSLLVGARGNLSGSGPAGGAAYLYDAVTGVLLRTFNNPEPGSGDKFGWSVSIFGNNVLVGASSDDTGANMAGSAYLFDAATGALLHTLNNPAPGAQDWYGSAVAVSEAYAVVGCERDNLGDVEMGSVSVFDAVTGALLHMLTEPTPARYDRFGTSVAVLGNHIVVGARGEDTAGIGAGTAYQFDAATGSLLRTFNSPPPSAGDSFGYSVAMSGNNILVGARYDDTGADRAGGAYLFDATTGALLRSFFNPTPEEDDYFGAAVGISGDNVVIGAYQDKVGGIKVGSAYAFDLSLVCPTVTPSPVPSPMPTSTPAGPSPTGAPCCPGDANNSGSFVDSADFIAVQANFGADNGTGGAGDADCSGSFIDSADFIAVQANFGADCGP